MNTRAPAVHVALRVEIDAHGEELHELARVVLLRVRPDVRVAVEPGDHRRVLGHLDEQVAKVPERVLAKQLVLTADSVLVLGRLGPECAAGPGSADLPGNLVVAGGEVVVPERVWISLGATRTG